MFYTTTTTRSRHVESSLLAAEIVCISVALISSMGFSELLLIQFNLDSFNHCLGLGHLHPTKKYQLMMFSCTIKLINTFSILFSTYFLRYR